VIAQLVSAATASAAPVAVFFAVVVVPHNADGTVPSVAVVVGERPLSAGVGVAESAQIVIGRALSAVGALSRFSFSGLHLIFAPRLPLLSTPFLLRFLFLFLFCATGLLPQPPAPRHGVVALDALVAIVERFESVLKLRDMATIVFINITVFSIFSISIIVIFVQRERIGFFLGFS